jgi:DNA-binding NtrC family response regulator
MRATSTAAAEEHPIEGSDDATAGATTPPSVVLLAEDDRAMRELLAGVFTTDGYEVLEAGDGSELISHLHALARTPHGRESLVVVISDVRMPRLDGLDVLAALRCAHWYTPVILITAFGDAATHRDAHDFGAVAVFDKPFDLSSLRDLVRQIAA